MGGRIAKMSTRADLARFLGLTPLVAVDRLFGLVLLLYIVGISAFNRDFARLNIPIAGIPLFVGEATIAILIVLIAISALRNRRLPLPLDRTAVALLVYLGIGSLFAIAGLATGYGLAAIRDFALVYYLVFFFFAAVFIQRTGQPIALLRALVMGAVVGSVVAVVRFLVSTQLVWEHAAPGNLALLAWVAVMYIILFRQEATTRTRKSLYVLALIACSLVIFLAAYRTMLTVVIASLALLWASGLLPGRFRIPWARTAASITTALVLILAVLTVATALTVQAGKQLTVHGPVSIPEASQVLAARWVRGIISTTYAVAPDVPPDAPLDLVPGGSFSFRQEVWRNALLKTAASPFWGIGYGPAPALHSEQHCDIAPGPTSNCGNAHNTYLTLAMRMGIPVFLFFVGINVYILVRFLPTLYRGANQTPQGLLGLLTLVAYVSFALYAFFSLFLESPYLSSLYWILLAVMHHFGSQFAPRSPVAAS